MKRSAAVFVALCVLATPNLRAQEPDLAAVRTRRAVVPADFAFRFASQSCFGESFVDTFTATRGRPTEVLPFVATPTELGQVNDAIERMNFFGYPSTFAITPAPGTRVVEIDHPSTSFSVRVRRNGEIHEVRWRPQLIFNPLDQTYSSPADPAYQQLVELGRLIGDIVLRHPEVKRDEPRVCV
jgi:hypothetical protein